MSRGAVRDLLAVLLLALAVLGVVVALIVVGKWRERAECQRKADGMERGWEYGWIEGCMIEADDGSMVPLDNWRTEVAP